VLAGVWLLRTAALATSLKWSEMAYNGICQCTHYNSVKLSPQQFGLSRSVVVAWGRAKSGFSPAMPTHRGGMAGGGRRGAIPVPRPRPNRDKPGAAAARPGLVGSGRRRVYNTVFY
jgi:hypothetical protein